MRHQKRTIKLGRTSAHRESMFANMTCSLIKEKRITTTLAKAKAVRTMAEKMVTLGKQGTLPARRLAISKLRQKDCVNELFSTIAPGFSERQGGYTRIMKKGVRPSDSSEMAILEWVDSAAPVAKKTKQATPAAEPAKPKKKSKKEAPAAAAEITSKETEEAAE